MTTRILLFACLSLASAAGQAADGSAADQQQINAVIERFRSAIIAKDRAALEELPLSPDTPMVPVKDAAFLAVLRGNDPLTKKARPGRYAEFVDSIVSSPKRQEERFSNIRTRSDGMVASVYFDYSFRVDGAVSNWGHETWGLVNTDEGWKISSIIWSVSVKGQP